MIPRPRTGVIAVIFFYLLLPALTSALYFAPLVGYLLMILMLSEIFWSWCYDILQSSLDQKKQVVLPKMMHVSRSRFAASF